MIPLSEVFEFLDVASKKNFFNENTIQSRRVACNKFFEILDEDQQNVEYVNSNLDVIKARFTNRYKDIRGNTVEQYARRVMLVMNDFTAWKADRAAWERDVAARQSSRAASDDEKSPRAEKPKAAPAASAVPRGEDLGTHTVTIPLPAGSKVVVTLPRELLVKDLQRVMWALLPYTSDWDPSVAPRQTFAQLEDRSSLGA